jgi:hypothetical protein
LITKTEIRQTISQATLELQARKLTGLETLEQKLKDYVMDDKTKKILTGISPIYALSQGKLPGLIGAGINSYNEKKDKKKERNEKILSENIVSGGVPEANVVAKTKMSEGGRTRGAGIAKKGTRACKMR